MMRICTNWVLKKPKYPLRLQWLLYVISDCCTIKFSLMYEGESVSRPQIEAKRETCEIRTWENIY
jgi:hypothetical protein